MTFLVLRNEEYAILKWFAEIEEVDGRPGPRPARRSTPPSVASGYGVNSKRVSGREELHEALKAALASISPSWSRSR